ncbi:hypothetical protein, partial [Vibrio vulnificus]|uniref:hypothetical protein n=1 Tax=Vibrio vulnificus TaxID=672 RepID=UPI001CCFE9D0|nr:hypothetical protein [Vibrio vulnificus]
MSLSFSTNLSRPCLGHTKFAHNKPRTTSVVCSAASNETTSESAKSPLQTLSAAVALSAIILSAAPVGPASADISGLTPCKESKQFAKREKQSVKKR